MYSSSARTAASFSSSALLSAIMPFRLPAGRKISSAWISGVSSLKVMK